MKRVLSIFLLLNCFPFVILSQTFLKPNYALKSHETLEIRKVELSPVYTKIFFTIENRIEQGIFCADKNIFLINPDGSRLKLTKASGIPACPDAYKFRSIGEKLDFDLTFPPLKQGTEWIDIVEECSSNCFWFYGVTLNNDLNRRLDEAFSSAETGTPRDNIPLFRNILESFDSKEHAIEGLLYVNIINAAGEADDKTLAAEWYRKLLSSHVPRLSQYVKYLNDRGIKYPE